MRRGPLLTALVAVALGLAAFAAFALWPRGPQPALRVTPNPIDFGDVPWLETKSLPVEIRNVSDREVFLRDLAFDCSCFAASRPSDALRLLPGQVARLEVQLYTPKTTAGRFRKTFTVRSTDPVAPEIHVPMTGNIRDFRSVTPREVALGSVASDGEPVTRTVEVRGGHGSVVTVVEAVASDARIETEVRPAKEGSDVLVRTKRGAAKGRISAQVRMTLEVSQSDHRAQRYADSVWVNGEVR